MRIVINVSMLIYSIIFLQLKMRDHINRKLVKKSPATHAYISNLMKQQASFERSDPVNLFLDILFQLDTIFVSSSSIHAMNLFRVVFNMNFTCPHVKTLKSYFMVDNCKDNLSICKSLFPNIKSMWLNEFHDDCISDGQDFITRTDLFSVRTFWPDLEELYFVEDGTRRWTNFYQYSNDQLCNIFFSGMPLSQVEKLFIEDKSPVLSFKKLRRLSISVTTSRNHEFLSLLLYFYPRLDFQVNTELDVDNSGFSSFVSHNVALNPSLKLSHCGIHVEDLRLPYIGKILQSWVNLESLDFIVTSSIKFLNVAKLTKIFVSLFKNCIKLSSLQIKIYHETDSDSNKNCLKLLSNSLSECGTEIKKLEIDDKVDILSLADMAGLVGSCPNLTHLHLRVDADKKEGCIPDRYKLWNPLVHLTHFQYTVTNNDGLSDFALKYHVPWIYDMIRRSPSLIYLETHLDASMVRYLSVQTVFPPNILIWNVHVTGELDNINQFYYILNKSKLRIVVLNEEHHIAPGDMSVVDTRAVEYMSLRENVTYNLASRKSVSSLIIQVAFPHINRQSSFNWMSNYDFGL